MTWLDPFVLLALLLAAYAGWRMGLVGSLVPLLCVLAASGLAVTYGLAVSRWLHAAGSAAADGIGRIVILLSATALLWGFFRWLVQIFLVARLSTPDRAAGLAAMLLAGSVFSASLCGALHRIPLSGTRHAVEGSVLGNALIRRVVPGAKAALRLSAVWAIRNLEDGAADRPPRTGSPVGGLERLPAEATPSPAPPPKRRPGPGGLRRPPPSPANT